jgi:HD-GYP domain-containing protein (c-di-GMP phosphodiesterase class II)/CHASE2 domain-containing sensor protein
MTWNKAMAWIEKFKKKWILRGLIVALVLFLFQELHIFRLADAYWIKGSFALRHLLQLERIKTTPIVVITIDSQSMQKFGALFWRRKIWRDLTNKLESQGASVIAYDVNFSTPSPEDSLFSTVLKKNVILPIWFEYAEKGKVGGDTPPIHAGFPSPPLLEKSRQGFVNLEEGALGVKKTFLKTSYEGKEYFSFALQAYLIYKGIPENKVMFTKRRLYLGKYEIPLDWDGAFWINFKTLNFEEIPLSTVLNAKETNNNVFKNKIVFIGVTSPLVQELESTPLGPMPNVDVQAEILRDLLQRSFLLPMNAGIEFLLTLVLGVVLGMFLPLYPWKRFLPWVGLGISILWLLGFVGFVAFGVIPEVFTPSLLIVIMTMSVILEQSNKTELALSSKMKDIQMFQHVSLLQTGNVSLEELLSSSLEMIQEIMNVEMIGVLLKEENGQLILNVMKGVSCETSDRRINLGEGICGRVATTGKAMLVSDLHTNPYSAKFEKKLSSQWFLAVPLVSKGEIFGVLWAGSNQTSLEENAQARLMMIANQLAVSVQNSILTQKSSQLYLNAIRSLLRAVEYYHPSIKGHSERVASYSMMLAKAKGLPLEETEAIRVAALLHDISRMGQFEAFYRKPEGLTDEDWRQIVTPLKLGLKILEPLSGELPILPILSHFYERWDGKGFPDKLKGENIPIGSRILVVANTFDDIATNSGMVSQDSVEHAVQILKKGAGTLFDPDLVKIFVVAITSFPAEEFLRRMKQAG